MELPRSITIGTTHKNALILNREQFRLALLLKYIIVDGNNNRLTSLFRIFDELKGDEEGTGIDRKKLEYVALSLCAVGIMELHDRYTEGVKGRAFKFTKKGIEVLEQKLRDKKIKIESIDDLKVVREYYVLNFEPKFIVDLNKYCVIKDNQQYPITPDVYLILRAFKNKPRMIRALAITLGGDFERTRQIIAELIKIGWVRKEQRLTFH